jgi:hypothetical protein
MAGVAAQSFLEMPVGLEIGCLLTVAGRAEFVGFLARQRQTQQQESRRQLDCPRIFVPGAARQAGPPAPAGAIS